MNNIELLLVLASPTIFFVFLVVDIWFMWLPFILLKKQKINQNHRSFNDEKSSF